MYRLDIRRKALIALLGVAVPSLLTFSLLLIATTAHILEANATRQVSSLANRSAVRLAELVEHARGTLLTMAATPEIREFCHAVGHQDHLRQARALRELERSFLGWQRLDSSLQAIRLVDLQGNVLVKVKEGALIPATGPPRPPYRFPSVHSVADRPFFRAAVRLPDGGILISNLERGKVEGEEGFCPAMVRFAVPLTLADGRRVGILMINVWGEQAGRMINRLIDKAEGSAFLVERNRTDNDRNGIYLFHQDRSCQFGDQTGSHRTVFNDYPASITAGWMSTDHGVTSDPRSNDILAHAYYSPYGSADRGWVVVVNARTSFFLGPLSTIGRLSALWALVVVVIATAVSLFFARSLTRPIQTVIEGVRRMGGHPEERITPPGSDEVGFLADEINRMADALQQNAEDRVRVEEQIRNTEKLASVGEMAAGLAHELNTPLGNIKALALLSRKEIEHGRCDRSTLMADMDDIADQAGKCSGIIGGLLSFARRSSPRLAPHDPLLLLHEALSLVRLRADKQLVGIRFDEPPPLPLLTVDGDQLRQVFVNLLLNGIDAAPGGCIDITVRHVQNRLAIAFHDTGNGIAAEHLERIFDPFFTTKEVGQGTGLGLSVSYGIISNLGGTIEVNSTAGHGTTFTVILPAPSGDTP